MTNTTILVTGATGKTGRRVLTLLLEENLTVRAGSRSSETPFDWDKPTTWPAALHGVDAIYVVHPGLGSPTARDQVRAFARVASDAGVRKAVMVSVPDVGGMDVDIVKATEQSFPDAGIELTVLRLRCFFQNFSEDFLIEPVLAGALRLPAGNGREAFIDADDIAEVVVVTLTNDAHDGLSYELTGPEALTFSDIATELSTATGRIITYEATTLDDYIQEQTRQGVPAERAQMLGELYGIMASGALNTVSTDVEKVLGKPARNFRGYAEVTAATWQN